MTQLSAIVQIGMTTTKPAESTAFYRDVLGLKLMFETNGMTFYQAGSLRLMVGFGHGTRAPSADTIIYFDCGDWRETEAALEGRGVVFTGPAEVVQRAEGKEHALRFFRDPDGHQLAIMGWRSAA